MQLRLDKLLADAGFGTRSTVRTLIRSGSVMIDGTIVKSPETKVDITSTSPEGKASVVTVNGAPVFFEPVSYYLLYKPAGVVSATTDPREKTVIDLIPEPRRRDLFPVGRLDKDTTGLLLITNDGKLSNRLLAPGRHVPKTYRALVTGTLPEDVIPRFLAGLDIGDEKPTAPANLQILESTPEGTMTELTITEGRYHQVKRMFEAVGCQVILLKRVSMGGLILPDDMKPGDVRKLSIEELTGLL